MTLADNRPQQIGDLALNADSHALLSCTRAEEFIFVGQYEDAREALGTFWLGVGARPSLEAFSPLVTAEVLLRCGALSGYIGSSQHLAGAQEAAKDLLSEALRIFEIHGQIRKAAEVHYELGICYWRLGALDEAQVVLREALRRLTEADLELRAKILIRQTMVEISAHRYYEAWEMLKQAEPVFEFAGDALKGRWHTQKALVLLQIASAEKQDGYSDRAVIEFTAAIYHLEQAKHERLCGANINNLAFLLYKLGRYTEAHEQLDRARGILARLNDSGVVAQVDETQARVLVAEGRYAEAKIVIAGAVAALREGGEQALLADALTVQGIVQSRLGEHEQSVVTLREAMDAAEYAGALESAGHAALALVEEHGEARLSADEVYETYRRADSLLARTQDAEDIARLRDCARLVMCRFANVALPEGFSLPRAVRAYEARFVEQALIEESGSVSRAARRLGVKHQSLAHMLSHRHKGLLSARTPVVPRRRSIIRLRQTRNRASYETPKAVRPVSILQVEDNVFVAGAVRDTLELEGWRVEVCADGLRGLNRLEGEDHYDLIILDYDLPSIDGLQLAQRARRLPHRRSVPIVMLSASDHKAEARLVGVDAFLKKPDGVSSLVETIRRLLPEAR
jgi:CheY-like chemotaxis protein/tetratricopeptide (TPR) repeat protein